MYNHLKCPCFKQKYFRHYSFVKDIHKKIYKYLARLESHPAIFKSFTEQDGDLQV